MMNQYFCEYLIARNTKITAVISENNLFSDITPLS
jgi:hypothetical protein